ncbi:hypothetical protein [Mangrovimonas sp. TPBH4]|uniref:hypothetical protein n=1 Tax=Mangrovimonas sp. TPBH4 TaxID=1645914 RepID=UPI0012F7709C|nr:hypothetical protein [Mangrovimonas sp. TPBH4]
MATSCQEEDVAPNQPDTADVVNFDATLVSVMALTSANDGTLDDILDNASCLSVDLPVTVIVNETSITVNTLEDLQGILEIFDEFDEDDDTLEFLYPITILLNDYSEIVINNDEELELWIETCEEALEVIDCIDFVYPISFSIYNCNSQATETVTLESDWELYEFLQELQLSNDAQLLASINFPITMVLPTGDEVEIASNEALLETIENAAEICNDDTCSGIEVDELLTTCYWEVESYNGSDDFESLKIYLDENGTLSIEDGDTTVAIGGNWQTSMSDQGVIVTLSDLTAFSEDLGGDWLVVDCGEEYFELVKTVGDAQISIVLERECEDTSDCNLETIQELLMECSQIPALNNYPPSSTVFLFNTDNQLTLLNEEEVYDEGTWELTLEEGELFLSINLNEVDTYNGVWQLLECEEDGVLFMDGDTALTLMQNCENESIFECFSDTILTQCEETPYFDGYTTFNLNFTYPDCNQDNVELSYFVSMVDAESFINPISNVVNYNPGEFPYEGYGYTVYARVQLAGGDDFEVFEVTLLLENCYTSECSEEQVDSYLMECHWKVIDFEDWGTGATPEFLGYELYFNENQELVVLEGEETSIGTWITSMSNYNTVKLDILGGDQPFYNYWLVAQCTSEELLLIEFGGGGKMTLVKECQ